MKRKLMLIGLCLAVATLFGAAVIGFQDWQLRGSAPGSPASGYFRMWADNASGKFKCLTSGGAACYFDSTGAITLKTNGTNNGSQSTLNLAAGSNMTLTDNGSGTITLASSGGGGSGGTTIFTGLGNPNGVGAIFSPSNMTAASSPSPYVVTASQVYSSYYPWYAFSATESAATSYDAYNGSAPSAGNPYFLEIDLGSGNAFILGQYKILVDCIYDPGTQDAPKTWTLDGSNDNSTWTTVDTRTNETSWVNGVYNSYIPATTTTAYRYFRIRWTAINGGLVSNIGKLQLYAYASAVTSGSAGDFYLQTNTRQLYGPRPSGGSPTWPLAGTLN